MNVRQVILAHWPLKAISLTCGLLVYFMINNLIQDEIKFEVPIRVTLDQEHAQTYHVDYKVRRVMATLKGPRTVVESFKNRRPTAMVELGNEIEGGVRAGTHVLLLKPGHLGNLPRQVQVAFHPNSLEVELFQIYEKRVLVNPILELETDLDCRLKYVVPQSVKIRGRRELIDNIDEINTLPIRDRIDYITQNEIEGELVNEINAIEVMPTPSRVTVVLDVKEKLEEHRLSSVPIGVLQKSSDLFEVLLDHEFVDLVIKGPPSIKGKSIKEISAESFMVFVDVRGLPVSESSDLPRRKVMVYSPYGNGLEVMVTPSDIGVRIQAP